MVNFKKIVCTSIENNLNNENELLIECKEELVQDEVFYINDYSELYIVVALLENDHYIVELFNYSLI